MKPRTHDRGTRRAKHIVFLVEFLVRLSIFSIPVKEIENMLSFWLVEFLNSFLDENVHTTGFLGKKYLPASFLLVFAEKLGRVYEA